MKWSGSKDSQSKEILELIPNNIINYYEPFIGGGSIFLALLESEKHYINKYYISDLNNDLINIYKLIKNNPKLLIDTYEKHHKNFNSQDIEYRKKYFIKIRTKYNKEHKPEDFYWIMRTTTNGMPRYNKKLEFNNSCHFSRSGMQPIKVKDLIYKYNKLFNNNNIIFYNIDYKDINIDKDSFLYLDPPYQNTKGMFFSNFNNLEFVKWVDNLKSKWLLSFDGKVNDINIGHRPPKYVNHKFLFSGNSSFRRVIGNSKDSIVQESIYSNF